MTELARFFRVWRQNMAQRDRSKWRPSRWDTTKLLVPLRAVFHPAASYDALKQEQRGSLALANGIFALLILSDILDYTATGFLFNVNRIEDFSLVRQLLQSALLPVLWCVANWAASTLFEGEGTFQEIWIVTFYAFTPYLLIRLPLLVLSNLLTIEEYVFVGILEGIALLISVAGLLIGLMKVQGFTLMRTVLQSLVSLFLIACILFIAMLFLSMFQQFYAFVVNIVRELSNRR